MMNRKRLLQLTVLALAAMALAVPTAASAGGGEIVDVDDGDTAEIDRDITFTGTNFSFHSELGGFHGCHMHFDFTVENTTASHGSLQNVTIDTSSCTGTGFFAGCELIEDTVEGDFTVRAHDIDLLNVVIDLRSHGDCVFRDIDLTFPKITLTPQSGPNTSLDDMNANAPYSYGGVMHINDIELETGAEAGATFEAWGSDEGTWRIATHSPA